MMKLFPDRSDDLLDVASLPSTEHTELNYRTRPLTKSQELRLTLVMLLGTTPIVMALASVGHWLMVLHPLCDALVGTTGLLLVLYLAIRWVTGATTVHDLTLSLLFVATFVVGKVWSWIPEDAAWPLCLAISMAWGTSCLLARQVAAWILVGPTVDRESMDRWRVNLPCVPSAGLSLDCPELLTFALSPLMIVPAWLMAVHFADDVLGHIWLWPFCFVATLHVAWFLWHAIACLFVPWPKFARSWKFTWEAMLIFITYDLFYSPAAGVFRFPTRWLRRPVYRWTLLVGVLQVIALTYATLCPRPADTFWEKGIFVGQMMTNLGLMSLTAPLVLCSILWFTSGTLLVRFDHELSHHRIKNNTEWDNYVDRIINSKDELETEHLFSGATEKTDYPVLIHDKIFNQHVHVVGDSGASKTTLVVAPHATQLIARASSSVVIIDLKGDKALLEGCRREAARAGLRFRWIANDVGKTSFGFNPLLQSHNAMLSVDQLTQQLLQGLSLDYGIEYGAGYFTAMNETVLGNVLTQAPARSFLELDERLSDRHWYQTFGHIEDWSAARHLVALVNRLSRSQAINVVPGMYPELPQVDQEVVDVSDVLAEPQVVYLWLRSAIEPTNAPAIARLFLWSMFNAASHQPQDKNRVYLFIDEIQQIVGDGMKLIFEQFRDLGGTIIGAHQTIGQLSRQGTDLADTIESCTAVKQVLRASDLKSLERIEQLSGTRNESIPTWYQAYERGTGDLTERYAPIHAMDGTARLSESERLNLNRKDVLAISSRPQSSLIRFTCGSGYTQFAGATIPIVSPYTITFDEYTRRRQQPWPTAPGAFAIKAPALQQPPDEAQAPNKRPSRRNKKSKADPPDHSYSGEFRRRGKSVPPTV